MKKKAIKIAASTAVAASAFVAAAPANKADAAVNVDQLVKAAEASAKVLQWSISTEGTANFVDRPYAEYNAAKKTNAAAKAAIAKLSTSEKVVYEARLLDSDIQIKRAQAYIDALTSGEKIRDKQAALDKAIKAADLKSVQSSYHVLTAEIRKQAELLYRVYGQSTRDGILKTFKAPAESLYRSVVNEVTVLDHTALVDKYTKSKEYDKAVDHVAKAEYALKDVKQFKTALTTNLNDVVNALPLMVTSVSRVDNTTVQVNFTKALDVAPVTHFTFDKGLTVTSTKLSDDKKSVTLTVTPLKDNETYTLSYKGEATKSFTTPKAPDTNNPISGSSDEVRLDVGQYRTYVFNLKDTDGKPYYGDVTVELTEASILEVVTVNGKAENSTAVTPINSTTTKDGVLTVVVKASAVGDAALKVTNVKTDETHTSGDTIVIEDVKGEFTNASVLSVNSDKDYFTAKEDVSGVEQKVSFKKADLFQVEGKVVSYDEFKKSLTKHAKITVSYDPDNKTNYFNIVEKVDVKVLTITNPNKANNTVRVNPTTSQKYFDLQGTGEPGKFIKVQVDGAASPTYEEKIGSDGRWTVRVYLNEGKENTFTVGQYDSKSSTTPVYVTEDVTIWEGAFAVKGDVVAQSTGKLNFGEDVTFTFSTIDKVTSTADYTDKATFASNSTIVFVDDKGQKLEFQVGKEGTKIDSGNKTNAVTVTLGAPIKANDKFNHAGTIKLYSISGVKNQDGLNLTNFTYNELK
ncbi:hypothetical protein [Cytobacillus praedii]|uniref:hypothetical protein n=1 Tax=Cytobacillus praedii TaxID=1742358 RepID=UPI003AF6B72D